MKDESKPEKLWNWLWSVAVCSTSPLLYSLYLCFLNFLPKFLPQPGFHKLCPAERAGVFPTSPWLLDVFTAICMWRCFGICCKTISLHHMSVSTWSLVQMHEISNTQSPKGQKPSCMSLGEDLCDSTSKCGNFSSDPARFAQDTGCALPHSLKHSTADNSEETARIPGNQKPQQPHFPYPDAAGAATSKNVMLLCVMQCCT